MTRTYRTYDTDELRALADEGWTTGDIAAQFGVSYDAARSALGRRDIKTVAKRRRSLRERALDMPPCEAVDFLLGYLDAAFGVYLADARHPVDDWALPIARQQRALLIALYDADGGVVSKDSCLSAAMTCSDDLSNPPEGKIVDVQICRLRAVIPADLAEIRTVWGIGYALHVVRRAERSTT